MAGLRTVNLRISAKVQYIVLVLILAGLIGAVVFAYMEMSDMRRDLYGIRGDYYGWQDDTSAEAKADSGIDFEIVSQEVKQLRVYDYTKYDESYERKDVRVVETKIRNNNDYIYSYYNSLATVDENGVITRSVEIHADDNMNEWIHNYGNLELAAGGETTVYVYFVDDGQEITELINADEYF